MAKPKISLTLIGVELTNEGCSGISQTKKVTTLKNL